jgi:hypothetical protein
MGTTGKMAEDGVGDYWDDKDNKDGGDDGIRRSGVVLSNSMHNPVVDILNGFIFEGGCCWAKLLQV